MAAVFHPPLRKVRAQQQRIRAAHLRGGDERLDAGGGDLFAALQKGREHRDGAGRQTREQPRVPRRPPSEAEIFAAEQGGSADARKQRAQKRLGRSVAEVVRKIKFHAKVDARPRKQRAALGAGEQLAARLAAQHGHDADGQSRLSCTAQEGTMSEVEPVEPAHEQCAGRGIPLLPGYDQHNFFSARAMPSRTRAMP